MGCSEDYIAADGSKFIPKPEDDGIIFKGGCRCGAIKYTCSAAPSDLVLCHCRACQQLSGSTYLPFTDVPAKALQFISSMTLKTLKLSKTAERTFCTSCGSPITMAFHSAADETSLTWGSVDSDSLKSAMPKVKKHIFLKEKAPWVVLPDDGAEHYEEYL
jgi:hypothetical protein